MHSHLKGSAPYAVGEDSRPMTRKTVVLHGLGGMGKSSIALEYSFRYSHSYTAVFWVDVTSRTSLSRSARGIAEHIVADHAKQGHLYEDGASTLELRDCLNPNGQISSDAAAELRVTTAVKEWLAAKHNDEWLLVLDNYDDDAVEIRLLLPTCDTGNVIITSRKSNLQMLGKTVAVDEIDEVSGIRLCMKSANKEEFMTEGKQRGNPSIIQTNPVHRKRYSETGGCKAGVPATGINPGGVIHLTNADIVSAILAAAGRKIHNGRE